MNKIKRVIKKTFKREYIPVTEKEKKVVKKIQLQGKGKIEKWQKGIKGFKGIKKIKIKRFKRKKQQVNNFMDNPFLK